MDTHGTRVREIKKNTIDDDTRRTWIIASLRPHSVMYAAISNAETMEHTMQGMGTLSTKMDWDSFYSMIDSTAPTFDANQS